MKEPTQFLADVARRLGNTWYTDLTGQTQSWPHAFPLGEMTKTQLEGSFADVQRNVLSWRDWAAERGVSLTSANRRVHGTTQPIPTHVTVATIDAAAGLAGTDWVDRLQRGKARAEVLQTRFPELDAPSTVLRAVDGYSDSDFQLLCTAADWFASHDATGLTPRQVPIEGFHAKWLNTHQPLILTLTGKTTLGLLPRHPARIHFTYLDAEHRRAGGRCHDSATVGDNFTPAYEPRVVIISENKDTAIHFPPLKRGIAVEGAGYGGGTAAAFPWLGEAPFLLYWGDIDAHGFEILNGFRAAGLAVTSILMDVATYDEYSRFGTNADAQGRALQPGTRKDLPHLTSGERALYERITERSVVGPLRIEQERIPLSAAAAVAERILRDTKAPTSRGPA